MSVGAWKGAAEGIGEGSRPNSRSCNGARRRFVWNWRTTNHRLSRSQSTIRSIVPFSTSRFVSGRDITSTVCPRTTKRSQEVRVVSGCSSSGSGNEKTWRMSIGATGRTIVTHNFRRCGPPSNAFFRDSATFACDVRRSAWFVDKDEEELIVNQLSDGEKCTLALVGDLARRMAIANPNTSDPLHGEAIALIDEADLHLHPSWQRRLGSALAGTFPNCQFLLSTHSPAILSHLKPESIWILERTRKGVEATRPDSSYGQKVDRILEDIMDVSARPDEIRDKVSLLFLAIEESRLKKARQFLNELKGEIGTDPDLVKADLLIRRKETLGR